MAQDFFPSLGSGSMFVKSDISGNALMKYPASLSSSWGTTVSTFLNDEQQAWTNKAPLFSGTLEFKSMNGYDTSIIRDYFIRKKGSYVDGLLATAFQIVIQGVTYPNMVFDQDDFTVTVDGGELFSFNLKVRQLVTSYSGSGPDPSTFIKPETWVSAILSILTSHIPGSPFALIVQVALGGLDLTLYPTVVNDSSAWTLRTDTISVDPDAINGLLVLFTIRSLSGGTGHTTESPVDTLLVYDCYLTVTLGDSTTRVFKPSYAMTQNSTLGTQTDGLNILDGNPTTFDTITMDVATTLSYGGAISVIFL